MTLAKVMENIPVIPVAEGMEYRLDPDSRPFLFINGNTPFMVFARWKTAAGIMFGHVVKVRGIRLDKTTTEHRDFISFAYPPDSMVAAEFDRSQINAIIVCPDDKKIEVFVLQGLPQDLQKLLSCPVPDFVDTPPPEMNIRQRRAVLEPS